MAFNFYRNACKILIVCFASSTFVFSACTPIIDSISVINRTLVAADNDAATTAIRVYVQVGGANLGHLLRVRPALVSGGGGGGLGDECVDDQFSKYEFVVVWSNSSSMVLRNEFEEPLPSPEFAICIQYNDSGSDDNVNENSSKWLHQGGRAQFRTSVFSDDREKEELENEVDDPRLREAFVET
jgi:hypothetical protein